MRPIVIACASLFLSQTSFAAVRNVPADYPTIQEALNAATSGDVVLVAPGTYHEHLQLGLFQAGVKLHSSGGAAVTVIDGDGTNFAIDLSNAAGTEVVGFTIQNGVRTGFTRGGGISVENSSTLISDNVIQNCSAYWGGGIYVDPSGTASILRNTIQRNTSVSSGGGIYYVGLPGQIDGNVIASNSSYENAGLALGPDMMVSNNHFLSNVASSANGAMNATNNQIVRGNEFRGNQARFAGALTASGSAVVDSNTFVGNSAYERAGAVEARGSSVISRNLFLDNSVEIQGGAIYTAQSGKPTIRGNVIARNSSLNRGGGVMIDYLGAAVLENNTIVLNTAPTGGGVLVTQSATATLRKNIVSHSQAGGGVVRDASSGVTMSCNDVWGNVGSDYSGLPDQTGIQGNISSDPLYCGFATLDFHLAGASFCAPAHSGACGLIGALDVNCDTPVATRERTWGSIKAQYR